MTREEFEQGYAQRSRITVERLHELGQRAEPCDCGDKICKGWAMVNAPAKGDEMEEITQEKALEYRQVASILNIDIEMLHDMTKGGKMSKEDMVKQIGHLYRQKEKVINDPKVREMRFNSMSMLFNLAAKRPEGPDESEAKHVP